MRVAVVGSGVSGLAATWLLNEHSDHTVELYEADSRLGGHANTVQFTPPGEGRESVDVDTGFIVFNPTTYPNFLRFLRLHKNTNDLVLPTEMTFSVSRDGGAFEWAGKNLFTVFCQPKNLLDPAMWRLLWDVTRFNAMAGRILLRKDEKSLSIGEYLDREAYSASFTDNYLIATHDCRYLEHSSRQMYHGLSGNDFDTIFTQSSPSADFWEAFLAYIERWKVLSKLDKSRLHISSPVESLTRLKNSKILLKTATGISETYDHVILACHSDEAIRILRNGEGIEDGQGITSEEERILSAFQWNRNEVVLHSDVRAQYGPVLVTLNAPFEPHKHLTVGRWKYDHPVIDHNAVKAQQQIPSIQGTAGVSFAGAYLRFGFHEDGFTSGLVAAAALSSHAAAVRPPFKIEYAAKNVNRSPGIEAVAGIFEWVEKTGVRSLVGFLGSLFLSLLRLLLVRTGT
ncbi:hypothetical protein C0993_005023 [Termitomyces sp. T159_Od127]|nr:hypothetical protein C0993_005023 [Termitomyces sp. T159_Od127]